MPRRWATTTVWSFASSAAIGNHMSRVSPKSRDQHDRGPMAADADVDRRAAFTTCELRKSPGRAWARRASTGGPAPAGGEAGRDSAEAAGERGRNGCGHPRFLFTAI